MLAYRRDLPGKIDVFCQIHLALLERAVEISFSDSITAICLLVDQGDEAVFDLKVHREAFFDLVLEVAFCLDR